MKENGKISILQFKLLVVFFSLGSSILIIPSGLSKLAKQDAWISAIIGMLIGLLLIILYSKLGRLHPGKNLAQFSELMLGKVLGKCMSALFFTYFFLISTLVLRNIGDFISSITLPETPIQAIHILFLLIVVMAVRLGLEVFARASEIFFPWIVFLIMVLILFIAPQMELQRMQPVFEGNIRQIMHGSLAILGIPYLELITLLMIYPYVNRQDQAGKAFLRAGIFAGIILVIITLLCILVLGADFTERHAFPSYTLAKKIHIGEFLQRIEVLMAVIWFLTIFFKLAISFYASMSCFAQLLGLRSYRSLLMPFAMIMVVLALVVYPDMVYFREFTNRYWLPYAATFGFVLPLLLLFVSLARQPQSDEQPKAQQAPTSHDLESEI